MRKKQSSPAQAASAGEHPGGMGSAEDGWGIGAFLVGLFGLTALGFYATRDFTQDVCGAILSGGDDALGSVSALVEQHADGASENSAWALDQVGMCLNSDILTSNVTTYPPSLGLAFASMILGLLGGTSAVANRLWPRESRTAPQVMSDAATGGSVGLALLALAGMLDWVHGGAVVAVIVGFLLVCMWVLHRNERWLKTVLLLVLVLAGGAVVWASIWPSGNAWENVFAWCLVLGLLAGGAIAIASAASLLKGRAELQEEEDAPEADAAASNKWS